MNPKCRKDDLLVEEVGSELVIYNEKRQDIHRLNATTALVWKSCDGQSTPSDIALRLEAVPAPSREAAVWSALEQLSNAGLLEQAVTRPATIRDVSRREVIRMGGLAASLGALIPVLTTVLAPQIASAQGHHCGNNGHGGCSGTCPPLYNKHGHAFAVSCEDLNPNPFHADCSCRLHKADSGCVLHHGQCSGTCATLFRTNNRVSHVYGTCQSNGAGGCECLYVY